MEKSISYYLILLTILVVSCGAPKGSNSTKSNLDQELTEKNRGQVSLLQRIRQKSGVIILNNVPIINKIANSFTGSNQEPLYVLNGQVIGNSFRSNNDVVENYNVEDITILTGAEASPYGSQGGNRVILITTY
jgi:TonB-dependent SusC/RagA subfamily outer membrane receptor